ncbi:MAG: hypothetical protein AB7L66_01005 [Gemmatimonadales bacterium]
MTNVIPRWSGWAGALLLAGTSGPVAAQRTVPVANEPRHHAQLENTVVRVFDVIVPVGDTTLYHVHTNAYTYVSVGPASLTAQVLGADPFPLVLRDGEVRFSPPVTHRVANPAAAPFHNVTIELLSRRDRAVALPPVPAGDSVVLENDRLRAVHTLVRADEVHPVPSDERTLLVFLSAGVLHLAGGAEPVTINARPGSFHWVGGTGPRQIHNASAGPIAMLTLTLK